MMNSNSATPITVLPCRGCTSRCSNSAYCNGRLWRMCGKSSQPTMNIVIYGGNGFVGTTIAEQCVAAGFNVRCVSRNGKMPQHLNTQKAAWAEKVDWLQGDAASPDKSILAWANAVISTVGSPPLPAFTQASHNRQYHANGGATIALINACANTTLTHFIFVGAQIPALLNTPKFAYAKGKADAIAHAKAVLSSKGICVSVLLPSVIYGTRHSKSGRAISLRWMSIFRRLLTNIRERIPKLRWLGGMTPVPVEHVANACIEQLQLEPSDRQYFYALDNEAIATTAYRRTA